MMLIPALLVMLVDWNNSRQHLAVLDGPGLVTSFEASLELARQVLDLEKDRAQDKANKLARGGGVGTSPEAFWIAAKDKDSAWNLKFIKENSTQEKFPIPKDFSPEKYSQPRRWKTSSATYLLAAAPLIDQPGDWVLIAQRLPDNLDSLLDEVSRGGAGVRQLRHFYSRLLRSNMVLTLTVLTFLLLLLSLFLSHRLARFVARPLMELSLGTERVAAGDLTYQVDVNAPDELGRLVRAFNRMTNQLLQGREDLRRAERIAAWQGVARRLAHEIKNPLTPITLAMHRIGKKSDDPTINSCVQTVLEEASNLGRIADEFSLYAKMPQPVPELFSAEQVQELFESLAQFYLARTRVEYGWNRGPEEFNLWVDTGQLRQVMSNLIKNGNEAMQGEGSLKFEISLVNEPGQKISSEHSGPWIRCSIRDTGPGLPTNIDDIFEPYATTKATGTGLGLAVARRIIEDNGGCLWAESSPDGAAFIFDLPEVTGVDENQLVKSERNSS